MAGDMETKEVFREIKQEPMPLSGLEKYLNSTLAVGQVTLKVCWPQALSCLHKLSSSLIIHKPKNGNHTVLSTGVC